MSKENKKEEAIKQEPAKEPSEAKQEATKTLTPQQEKESNMAKQIIDLEAQLNQAIAEIQQRDEALKKANETNKELINGFKSSAIEMENKANALLKQRFDELEAKFKKDLDLAKKYAIKDQALELINIINEFEQAVSFKPTDPKIANWLVGFKMYLTKFNNLLADLNISPITPEIGVEFDANCMECFADTVKDATKKDNTVIEVIHNGYKLHDIVIKPALVKVIKNN